MVRTGTRRPGIWCRMKAGVRDEPKKTIILGLLFLVLAAVVVREVLREGGPAKATAAIAAAGGNSMGGTASPAVMPAPGATGLDANDAAGSGANGEALAVDRDLFTPDPTYFPPHRKASPATVVSRVDDSVAMKEAQERAVRAQAQALTLQSTIVGVEAPTAIVNGEVLRVGDMINGFCVVAVAARTCTVEKANLRITLEMTN